MRAVVVPAVNSEPTRAVDAVLGRTDSPNAARSAGYPDAYPPPRAKPPKLPETRPLVDGVRTRAATCLARARAANASISSPIRRPTPSSFTSARFASATRLRPRSAGASVCLDGFCFLAIFDVVSDVRARVRSPRATGARPSAVPIRRRDATPTARGSRLSTPSPPGPASNAGRSFRGTGARVFHADDEPSLRVFRRWSPPQSPVGFYFGILRRRRPSRSYSTAAVDGRVRKPRAWWRRHGPAGGSRRDRTAGDVSGRRVCARSSRTASYAAAVQIVAWSTLGGGVWSRARRARDGRRERAEGAILAGEALDGGGARVARGAGFFAGGRARARAVVDVSTVSRDRGWRARGAGRRARSAMGVTGPPPRREGGGWSNRVSRPLAAARARALAAARAPSPKPLDRPTRADEDIGRRAVARGGVPMTASSSASSCMRSSRRSSWRSCSSSRARYDEVAIAARSAAEGVDVPSQGIHARARGSSFVVAGRCYYRWRAGGGS